MEVELIPVSTMTSVLTTRTTAAHTLVALLALTPSLASLADVSLDTLETGLPALTWMNVMMVPTTAVIQLAL